MLPALFHMTTDRALRWTSVVGAWVVNQHAKITRERVKTTSKSFHPSYVMIRHFVGVPWGVINGSYSRNQATSFH